MARLKFKQKQKKLSAKHVIDLRKLDPAVIKRKIQEFFDSDTAPAKITSVLLGLIAVPGILAVGLAVPNLFACCGNLAYKRRYQQKCRATIAYAKKAGYIEMVDKNSQQYYALTKKGNDKLYFQLLHNLKIDKSKKWDGKWRIVIFDIPNKYNRARDFLRDKLRDLQFVQMQKSVYMCPWECFKEIDILRKAFRVQKYVSLITAVDIENVPFWKVKFELQPDGKK